MVLSLGRTVLALLCLAAAVGGGVLLLATSSAGRGAGAALLAGGLLGLAAIFLVARRSGAPPLRESDDVTELSLERRRELMRGTSLYLREMRYRYSVRLDMRETTEHRSFAAEVNSIRLGFIPAVITDNTTDRQGAGFVAFVHDGNRWRGPGLPCPSDQVEAVRHAARCVSPLATDEETHLDGEDA